MSLPVFCNTISLKKQLICFVSVVDIERNATLSKLQHASNILRGNNKREAFAITNVCLLTREITLQTRVTSTTERMQTLFPRIPSEGSPLKMAAGRGACVEDRVTVVFARFELAPLTLKCAIVACRELEHKADQARSTRLPRSSFPFHPPHTQLTPCSASSAQLTQLGNPVQKWKYFLFLLTSHGVVSSRRARFVIYEIQFYRTSSCLLSQV